MAATRSSMANEYEDFEPNFQWKEDESSNILVLHLPEFEKEQMKITYVHSSGVVRVTGEKPISKKKWRRFNKSFPVPHNCNVQKIQAKFQRPNLTITLPKTTPSIPTSNQDLNNKDDRDTKKQEIPKHPPITQPSEKKKEGKSIENDEKEQVEAKAALLEKEDKNNKKREESFLKEDELVSKKSKKEDEALTKPLVDDTKDQLPKKQDESALKLCDEKAKRVIIFGREISEDKQSLVNVGVAILVIAALGAYVSYTYGSSSNSKN